MTSHWRSPEALDEDVDVQVQVERAHEAEGADQDRGDPDGLVRAGQGSGYPCRQAWRSGPDRSDGREAQEQILLQGPEEPWRASGSSGRLADGLPELQGLGAWRKDGRHEGREDRRNSPYPGRKVASEELCSSSRFRWWDTRRHGGSRPMPLFGRRIRGWGTIPRRYRARSSRSSTARWPR